LNIRQHLFETRNDHIPTEFVSRTRFTLVRESVAQLGVRQQLADRVGHRVVISRPNQQAGFTIQYGVGNPADPSRNAGGEAERGFQEYDPKAFDVARNVEHRQHEQIRAPKQLHQLGVGQLTEQPRVIPEAQRIDSARDRLAEPLAMCE